MNSKLSIIVPVYNVSEYLERGVGSLLSQEYENIEIILVNDGSPDDSLEKCRKFAEKDKRIIVIDKKNGGVSSARNAGLDVATGEYIGFLDPDDWIEPEMYSTMIKKLNEHDADMIFCNFVNQYKDHSRIEINRNEELCLNGESALEYCLKSPKRGGGYFTSIWNKIFRRKVVFPDGYCIYFKNGITVGEDELWLFNVINKKHKVCLISNPFYNYLQREGSAISTRAQRKITKQVIDSIDVKRNIYDWVIQNKMSKPILQLTKERLFYDTYRFDRNIYKIKTADLIKQYKENYRIGKDAFYSSKNYSKLCKVKIFVNRFLINIKAPEKLVHMVDSFSVNQHKK